MRHSVSSTGVSRRPRPHGLASAAAVGAFVIAASAAQTAFAQGFDRGWVVNKGGVVNANARAGSVTFIGGKFDYVGPNTGGGATITTNVPTGVVGTPFRIEGEVHACEPDPNGGFWIGGNFTRVGAFAVTNLAHIDGNGNISTGFAPNPDGPVFALEANSNFVCVGGQFTTIAGQARTNFARLTSGVNPAVLDSLVVNTNLPVRALAVDASTNMLYMGGDFTTITVGSSTFTHERAAQVSLASGSLGLTNWRRGTGKAADAPVLALAIRAGGGAVIIGGDYLNFGPNSRNRMAKVKTDGSVTDWTAGVNACVRALVSDDAAEDVFIGGDFTTCGGHNRKHLARVEQTGTGVVLPWNPGADGANASVNALAINNPGFLVVGGTFTELGGKQGFRNMGRVSKGGQSGIPNGDADETWKPLATDVVQSLALTGTSLFTGGKFNSIGGRRHVNVAQLFFDAIDNSFKASAGWSPEVGATVNPGHEVRTLTLSGSTLFVGGKFTGVTNAGVPFSRFNACELPVALPANPTNWNPSPNGHVNTILAMGGGQVFLGGEFTFVGGTARSNVVRVSGATGVVDAWNPGVTDVFGNPSAASVRVVANAGNGDVFIGGEFAKVGGQNRNALAKVAANGTTLAWDAQLLNGGPAPVVRAIAPSPAGNTMFVGGEFTTLNAAPTDARINVAELQTIDGLRTAWMAGANFGARGVNGPVHALATVIGTNSVYVGGNFTTVGATQRLRIARFDATSGAASTTWVPGFGPSTLSSSFVTAIAADATTVHVGGVFDTTVSLTTPTTGRQAVVFLSPAF